jgi:tryptophanyl-tRNA synthetase
VDRIYSDYIRATHIPVGDDQKQHLELAKDLADTFNRVYKARVFPLPHLVASKCSPFPSHHNVLNRHVAPSCRILSLKDPTSKMSKSGPDTASRVLLTDTFSTISPKIKASVTDSLGPITYDPVLRPGTSNLLTILAACADEDVHSVAVRYEGKGHGALKDDVAEAIERMIEGPRLEFERIRGERGYLEEVARDGALRARERSEETMREVRARVGLP